MMVDTTPKSFAVFGTMRSGSNLLESLINQYTGLHCLGELFNPGFVGFAKQNELLGFTVDDRDADPQAFLDVVRKNYPGEISGFRIFAMHTQSVIRQALADETCAKVILRRNPLDSFVSLKIVMKTDQWLIHNEADRKQAKVHFNIKEFRAYESRLNAFYQMIEAALSDSGQPYFDINYDQLGNIDVINDLARFIGADEVKDHLNHPIKRQNPGTLADKIINYDEVYQDLGLPAPEIKAKKLLPMPDKGAVLSRVLYAQTCPLAFIPIPSSPENRIRDWLGQHGGFDKIDHGFDLPRWQDKFPAPVAFSIVRHPVARAYSAFMEKIFGVSHGSYSAIREALEKKYGIIFPDPELTGKNNRDLLSRQGYGIEEHRLAFKQFLVFVRSNLAGETDIRQDGKWLSQVSIVETYRKEFPDLVVFSEPDLQFGLTYLVNRMAFGSARNFPEENNARYLFNLNEIYSPEVEGLCQQAYADDYSQFGFGTLIQDKSGSF